MERAARERPLAAALRGAEADRGSPRRDGLGPVAAGFDVVERELRYRGVFSGLVDAVEPAGDGWRGVARYRGRRLGRFAMTRVTSARG